MPMFEVTGPGYNGDTDQTDARVFWVLAPDAKAVLRITKEVPNTTTVAMSRSADDCVTEIDFVLPREEMRLLTKLIRLELLEERRIPNR